MFAPGKEKRNFYILGSVLVLITLLVSIDLVSDFGADGFTWHISLELFIGVLSMSAFYWLIYSRESVKEALVETKELLLESETKYQVFKHEAEKWKKESEVFILGLSKSIDRQFDTWHFSPAEKDVALLLIKGLSLKEVADVRHTSEKTVRSQSLAVYAKASVKGRNELAAFFLEDLLAPSR